MATYLSYSYVNPYLLYIENLAYNVQPGIVTLTFDSPPSTNAADYQVIATQGILMYTVPIGFSTLDGSLVLSGNTAILTLPINMDTNAYMQFYYQGAELPFRIRCNQDPTYQLPAIFQGLAYAP